LSGIIGGVIVSLISGSQLAVSGPAAGLTTVVAATIVSTGDYRIFLLTIIIAGLFQFVLGILKLAAIAHYFPSAVIKGMLAAIGIILISKQIPIALGYDQPDFWTSGFIKIFSSGNFFGSIEAFNHHISRGTIVITAISLLILVGLKYSNNKIIKSIPPPLTVVVIGIIISMLFAKIALAYSLKATQTVNIPADVFSKIVFPDLSKLFSDVSIWKAGLTIGLLASLETLLCIEAIDKLDNRNRITPVNRELIAQGIGNITCGLLGAIPITAVVVRGAANVDAGARTKMSSFTHGVFLLLAILLIPGLLNMIPYASLSAILIITGFNLTRPKLFRNMICLGLRQFLPFIITIVMILLTDLLIGVSIGLLLSVYYIVRNNFKAEYKISKDHILGIDNYLIKLNSNVTFLNKVNLKKSLDNIPEYSVLTIDGSECNFIDYDILEIISEYKNKAHNRHIEINLKGIETVNVTAIH
jgi:MFS superfamily sulfate permease-like transporter